MQVDVRKYTERKGVTSRNLFDVIPVGNKGHSITQFLHKGTLTMTLNDNIRDNDIKAAVIVLNFLMQELGKELVDQIRNGAELKTFDENGQLAHVGGVKVKGTDISELLYHGDRKRGKRVFNSIVSLSNLNIRYKIGVDDYNMSLFQNVAYTSGNIVFDVANYLVVDMIRAMAIFRVQAILENDGFSARLALYTEMNQRPSGTYKDENAEIRTRYVPLNDYKLESIIKSLGLERQRSDRVVNNIQEAFEDIHKNSKGKFPKYTYNSIKKSFESEYKNGRKTNEK